MSAFFISHPRESYLALFAGGELGPLSRWRIERHLEGCDHCRDAVSDFFRLHSELNELTDTPDVDWGALKLAIHNDVTTARAQGHTAPARLGWAWQFGLVAASLVCAVAVFNEWDKPVGPVSPAMESLSVQPKLVGETAAAEPEVREEEAKKELAQAARSIEPEPQRVEELQKLEGARLARKVSVSAPSQFADQLVADTVAPPPPAAPYEIEAQPLVEAREADALAELRAGADLRQAPAAAAKRVVAEQLVDRSVEQESELPVRTKLRSILAEQGPNGLRQALEAFRAMGARLRQDQDTAGSDQVEGERLLRLLETRGFEAVIEDLGKT